MAITEMVRYTCYDLFTKQKFQTASVVLKLFLGNNIDQCNDHYLYDVNFVAFCEIGVSLSPGAYD